MRALRLGLDTAFALLLVLVLALVITLRVVPAITGWVPLSILSGSMAPDIPQGSLIWVRQGAIPETGEVATYLTARTPVTHRVTEVRPDMTGQQNEYIFRGDANPTNDPKPVPSDAVIGVLAGSVPDLGYAAYILSQPIGMALSISLGLLLIAVRTLLPQNKENTVSKKSENPMTNAPAASEKQKAWNNPDSSRSLIEEDERLRDEGKNAMAGLTEGSNVSEADDVEPGAVPADRADDIERGGLAHA